MKQLVIFGLLGGAAYLYFKSKKNFVDSVQYNFEKLQLDWKKKKVVVTLGVSNPTDQSVTVNSILGSLNLGSATIASLSNFSPVNIMPRAKSLLSLDLKPTASGILTIVKNAVLAKGKKGDALKKFLNASFVGSSNVQGVTIPLNIKLN